MTVDANVVIRRLAAQVADLTVKLAVAEATVEALQSQETDSQEA